jgi:hypothetical protein
MHLRPPCIRLQVAGNCMQQDGIALLSSLLAVASPEIRAAAIFGLGCLISGAPLAAGAEDQVCPLSFPAGRACLASQGCCKVSASPGQSAQAPRPLPCAQVAAEQAVAHLLLKLVYDASPLVRAELAVALARFVRGHMEFLKVGAAWGGATKHAPALLAFKSPRPPTRGGQPLLHPGCHAPAWHPPRGAANPAPPLAPGCRVCAQEAVEVEQQKVAQLVKAYQRTIEADRGSTSSSWREGGAMAAAAGTSAEVAIDGQPMRRSASSGSMPSGGSYGASGGAGGWAVGSSSGRGLGAGSGRASEAELKASSADMAPGGTGLTNATPLAAWQEQQQQQHQAGAASARTADSSDSLAEARDGAASAASLYATVLEAVLMLATDPSPKVAATGRRVLQLAHIELAPLGAMALGGPGGRVSSSGGSMAVSPAGTLGGTGYGSQGGSLGTGAGTAGTSLGSLTQKFVKTGRSWRSGFAGSTSSAQRAMTTNVAASVGGSTPSGSPPSPTSRLHTPDEPLYSRQPYQLRLIQRPEEAAAAADLKTGARSAGPPPPASDPQLGESRAHGGLGQLGGSYAAAAQQAGLGPSPSPFSGAPEQLPQSHVSVSRRLCARCL